MGSVRLGPPEALVLALRDALGARVFIETGTWKGGTAAWAARHFPQVVTIEGDPGRYAKTAHALAGTPHLLMIQGDSRTQLRQALLKQAEPAVLWLDAHWCGGGAAQAHAISDECPLKEELAAINELGRSDAVLIDDLRLFLNPPPYPHDPKQWPTYPELMALVTAAPRRVVVGEDILGFCPIGSPADEVLDRWANGLPRQEG